MRYVLGVDGGQTATTAIVADETGCLLGMGMGGPAHNLQEPGGIARAQKSLGDAITGAVRMADLQNARIAACCLGARSDREQIEVVCTPIVPTADLIFVPDTRIALYSVTLGRPGVVVVAGVSAGAYGVNARGEHASCGGWGSLLGDEGSGYWIAMRALNACCRAHDGIDAPTSLLPLVLKHLDVADLPHMQRLLSSERLRSADVAGLSEVVSRAAAQGDKTARRILREAGKELALGAQSVLRRLNMEGETVTVGTVGGVFRAGRTVLRTFREMVLQTAPNARIAPARVPPAVGAALIALEAIGIPACEDLLTNLEAALPRLQTVKA
jgi:N-acetylglucosamine kinase-like BadF-type ATPase